MGLGSPDKVPPLTEKQAVELGGDILAEFFVFGTAIIIVLIEYIRSNRKQASKETSIDSKVATLENETKSLLEKFEASNNRMVEINAVIVTQKAKIEELNAKLTKLDTRKNIKYATQASQTTDGRQIGKVMQAKSANNNGSKVSSDVTNSILYQLAEEAARKVLPFVGKSEVVNAPEVAAIAKTPAEAAKSAASKTAEATKQAKSVAKNGETSVKNTKTSSSAGKTASDSSK